MKKTFYISACFIIAMVITMCKKPYNPTISSNTSGYLVVEGLINSGTDSTIIKLSRTIPLDILNSNYATANSELKAVVNVEDDQNKIYPLKETTTGYYVAPPLSLNAARSYRLRITTANGQVYLSDYETAKASPPIDSVGFTTTNAGLTIYVNTHDAANNTRYYRWEYEEAWKFQVAYNSQYSAVPPPPGQPVVRTQSLYTCFANDVSSDIVLGSTTKLAQDVLFQAPIVFIPSSSEKLMIRYSILVKQYALSKEAYGFWTNLKSNTENLGSIFDAQPSAAPGNIHCVSDATQPVIGYVSVGTIQRKRIFVDKTDVRSFITVPQNLCGLTTILFGSSPGNSFPVDLIYSGSNVIGYTVTPQACADCTTRGTLKQPSFWK